MLTHGPPRTCLSNWRTHIVSTAALAAVMAKLTGLTAAGKTAVGLVVAAGAVGAAGGLPAVIEPAGQEPPTVVETEQAADDDVDVLPGDGAGTVDEATATDAADPTEPSAKARPEAAQFGQSVAEDARDGGVDGQEIAGRAHARNAERAAARDAEPATEDADDASATAAEEAADTAVADTAVTDAAAPGTPVNPGGRP